MGGRYNIFMLGVALSVAAALCFGLSTTLQKHCLRRVSRFSFGEVVRNRVWMISILIGLIGIMFYLTALKYAPISVVQPTLAISIAMPVLVGWFAFGENMGSRWVHIIFIIAGVLLISL